MLLNLGRDIRVKSAGLGRVLCPERTKSLAFPNGRPQVLWDDPAKPIDACFGMLERPGHC